MQFFRGSLKPFADELKTTRQSCGLYLPDDIGFFRCAGKDAVKFLHRLVTNDIDRLPIGAVRHNALLDRKGRVRALFTLIKRSDTCVEGIARRDICNKLIDIFTGLVFADDVVVTDVSDRYRLFILAGPHAPTFTLPSEQGLDWLENVYAVPTRNILVPVEISEAFRNKLTSQVPTISKAAIDLFRIEAGIPEYGIDISEENILLEGKLDHCYVRQKGCYPGQEVIERLHAYAEGKTPRIIAALTLPGQRMFQLPAALKAGDGTELARVTSCAYDPLAERTYLLAAMKRKTFEAGEELFKALYRVTT